MRIVAFSLTAALLALPALADERPLLGDPVNGQKLFQKATGKGKPKVDGQWLNRYSDAQALKGLETGKAGFPKIKSDNELDLWDVLAYLRGANTDVRDLMPDADQLLLSSGKLDQYAEERLKDQAKLKVSDADKEGPVQALYRLGSGEHEDVRRVKEDDNKRRDALKRDKKVGYVMFMPLKGVRGGGYEVGFGITNDITIASIEVRGPDGSLPDDLNQAARRFIGKGARGKYEKLRAPGAGKAMNEVAGPLSDAFLLASEHIYMFEVKERDYFAFEED